MEEETSIPSQKETITPQATMVSDDVCSDFSHAETVKTNIITKGFTWDERERLLYGEYLDTASAEGKNKFRQSTGELTTMLIDASNRIMAQIPTGKFKAVVDETLEQVITANLLYHEYIVPNANKGGDFLTKCRMMNMFSGMYGTSVALVEYVEGEHYTGSDFTVINPRRVYPQPGKYVVADMDWIYIETPVSKAFLEEKKKNSAWRIEALKTMLESNADNTKGGDNYTVTERDSETSAKEYMLRHRFDKDGTWTIYNPSNKEILLQLENYFPCIPVVIKRSIPVLDKFWCLCMFDRGETSQKNLDTFTEKFLEIVARKAQPITIVDPMSMVMSTVSYDSSFWFAKEGKTQEPRILDISPEGLISSFQGVQQTLKTNLMSIGATTDTSISKKDDVMFGRTPEALKMQGARESARDAQDRYMQERFMEDLAQMMIKVSVHRGLEEARVPHLQEALKKIADQYGEESIQNFGETIKLEDLQNATLRYEVDEGSTMQKSDAGEKTLMLLSEIAQNPEIMESLKEKGQSINWGEVIKRVAIDRGLTDWEKIIVQAENPESIEGIGEEGMTAPEALPEEEMTYEDYPEEMVQEPQEPLMPRL